jgi:hypothetical protein
VKIIFKWGIIAALVNCTIHALSNYYMTADLIIVRYGLEIGSLLFSCFCIYKAIRAYKLKRNKKETFLFLQGIKVGLGTVFVCSALFLIYSVSFYAFIDVTYVERHKTKLYERVMNSDKIDEEKESSLQMIDKITIGGFIFEQSVRNLILPTTIATLFIAGIMQRKYVTLSE